MGTYALMRIYISTFFIVTLVCRCLALAEMELIPLKPASWVVLSYGSKIPANEVSFSDGRLTIRVNRSAGPVAYKIEVPRKVLGFKVTGVWKGQKKTEAGDFDEDSILRFGLVATGTQRLTGLKKFLAADWAKKLFELAPADTGLDKIYFFNVTNRPSLAAKARSHPKSDLLREANALIVEKPGAFELMKQLDAPLEVAAIWLSVDGDDTASEFETTIMEIQLNF